jgi:hypothetical protein
LESKLNSSPPQKIVQTFDDSTKKVLPKSSEIIIEEVTLKKIPGRMPKGWYSENKHEELEKITENILDEQKKIETQIKIKKLKEQQQKLKKQINKKDKK